MANLPVIFKITGNQLFLMSPVIFFFFFFFKITGDEKKINGDEKKITGDEK